MTVTKAGWDHTLGPQVLPWVPKGGYITETHRSAYIYDNIQMF